MWILGQTTDVVTTSLTPTVETSSTTIAIFSGFWLFVWLLVGLLLLVAYWKIFTKAGQAGWKCLIPIYNFYILLKIVGRPGWWLLLMFIPFVNFVIAIIISLDLAKSFGKSVAFAIFGLIIFSVIGYLMLGFGDAEYKGPAALEA